MNKNKELLLTQVEGKPKEEVRRILRKNYGLCWDNNTTNKEWYAQVFTYRNANDLQEELDFFLWIINFFAPIFDFCFQTEDTVYLGCICPCGYKQTVLYYSLTSDL